MAFGCLKAIDDNRMHASPTIIAFITFDDYFFYNMNNFRISVVDNPGYQLGSAALFLMSRIQEGKRSRNVSSRRIMQSHI